MSSTSIRMYQTINAAHASGRQLTDLTLLNKADAGCGLLPSLQAVLTLY